ncbi:hypothetical protein, partial [Agrobacterium genomosp. 2]|uniref:hypothetical protein n=1 Tax=Agrobacterium genomosp. 2 TaxID=1183409 RepID=UPI001AC00478
DDDDDDDDARARDARARARARARATRACVWGKLSAYLRVCPFIRPVGPPSPRRGEETSGDAERPTATITAEVLSARQS